MARAFRVLAVISASSVAVFVLWLAFVFGSCEGWKGTGTCPRDPLWDWEVFWLGFWSGFLPTPAVRLRRGRVLRTIGESVGVGAVAGTAVVFMTGF